MAGSREGEAPAEPSSWATLSRSGSAGASPSLQGTSIDFGEPDCLIGSPVIIERWNQKTVSLDQVFSGDELLRIQ